MGRLSFLALQVRITSGFDRDPERFLDVNIILYDSICYMNYSKTCQDRDIQVRDAPI